MSLNVTKLTSFKIMTRFNKIIRITIRKAQKIFDFQSRREILSIGAILLSILSKFQSFFFVIR